MVQAEANMKLRNNTSTDDLLSLDSGSQTPDQNRSGTNSARESSSIAAAEDAIKSAPPPSPGKRKSALKLDLDEATWSSGDNSKATKTNRFRQNLKAGAARVTAVVQRGKTTDVQFRFVLVLLFGSIIGLVTFTWFLYQHQQQLLAIGDRLRLNEIQRVIHILDRSGRDVLIGNLGLGIPEHLASIDCHVSELKQLENSPWLSIDNQSDVCMEWKFRARFKLDLEHRPNISCYHVRWNALQQDAILKDCYSMENSNWYGMGEVRNLTWPLGKMSISSVPFITGDIYKDTFGTVLERYWLSSAGVTITVPLEVPLYVSINGDDRNQLCLEAKFEEFPYKQSPNLSTPFLHYSVCSGPNIKSIHEATIKKFKMLPESLNSSKVFLEFPVWSTGTTFGPLLNQTTLKAHADHIMEHGFEPGYILIDKYWQQVEGDLRFHEERFPDPAKILNILVNKGFKVLLSAHPYLSWESQPFKNTTVQKSLLIRDKYLNVPLLTVWQEQLSGIIDLTQEEAGDWFLERLHQLQAMYDKAIAGFLFLGGQSTLLPLNYRFHDMLINPDVYMTQYLKMASKTGPLMGIGGATHSQSVPAFVRLSPRTSNWDASSGLKSIIPSVLTLSLLGYPIINPGSIGGDISINQTKPSKELYMRWLQVAAFMPVVQFSIPPGQYDIDVIKAAKVLLKLREQVIVPEMNQGLNEYLENGTPLIRPMWWLAPEDPSTQLISTQFAIRDEIIVAPVLDEGLHTREIYLPPGWWRDEQGQIRKGGKTLHNYSVPLDKVAYFTRVRDDGV